MSDWMVVVLTISYSYYDYGRCHLICCEIFWFSYCAFIGNQNTIQERRKATCCCYLHSTHCLLFIFRLWHFQSVCLVNAASRCRVRSGSVIESQSVVISFCRLRKTINVNKDVGLINDSSASLIASQYVPSIVIIMNWQSVVNWVPSPFFQSVMNLLTDHRPSCCSLRC